MPTGIGNVDFSVVDLSSLIRRASFNRACVLIEARRGEPWKPYLIGSTVQFDRVFGKMLPGDAGKAALAVRRLLERETGMALYVARAVHHSDITDGDEWVDSAASTELDGAPSLTVANKVRFVSLVPASSFELEIVDPVSDPNTPATVAVATASGTTTFTITLETDSDGNVLTTYDGLVALFNASAAAVGKVYAEIAPGAVATDAAVAVAAAAALVAAGDPQLKFTASGSGVWPNEGEDNLKVAVTVNGNDPKRFDLTITTAAQPELNELYRGLSMKPGDSRYAPAYVNARSFLGKLSADANANDLPVGALAATNLLLDGASTGAIVASDYKGDKAAGTGLYAFDEVTDSSRLAIPAETSHELLAAGVAYCAARGDLEFVAVTPDLMPQEARDWRLGTGSYQGVNLPIDSRFGALYYGHGVVRDPRNGGEVTLPLTADVLGVHGYAESKGRPWTPKAGIDLGKVPNLLRLTHNVGSPARKAEADALDAAQINPVLAFPGQAPCVWGDQTLQRSFSALQQLNVQDLMLYQRKTIPPFLLRFVFKPNDLQYWRAICRALARFYGQLQADGALYGDEENPGFVVFGDQNVKRIEDAVLNTGASIDEGEYRVRVFQKPVRRMKYISFMAVVTETAVSLQDFAETETADFSALVA
ncbi:MAG: hypothetical protein RLY93_20520 [Sumerlaeia bacterium]